MKARISTQPIIFTLPIAALSLAILINQIYRVEYKNLTRWKGGGMGMFSSTEHPNAHVISARAYIDDKEYDLPLANIRRQLVYNLKAEPNTENARILLMQLRDQRYYLDDLDQLQEWHPGDLHTQVSLSNIEISTHRINFVKTKESLSLHKIKVVSYP